MEENSTLIKHPDNEIAYVIAKVYGVTVKFMIDTGANVSLIDTNMYEKIQKESKISLPTLQMCIRDRLAKSTLQDGVYLTH